MIKTFLTHSSRFFINDIYPNTAKLPKKKVGRQTGFEPATPGTTNQCSNQLSYYRHKELTKLRNHIESSTGKVYSKTVPSLLTGSPRLRHDNKLLFFVMLQAGIVGLPNVGKSTLFNALTKTRKAEAANYPFCTIDPNVGVVQVPDARLTPLAELVSTTTLIPAAIEMVDIAGLVEGASKGEGLGNKFLANVREVDAIVHVVRCFEDEDVIHNMGRVDPVADAEVIMTELILADAESVASQLQKNQKKARGRIRMQQPMLLYLKNWSPIWTRANQPISYPWMRMRVSG